MSRHLQVQDVQAVYLWRNPHAVAESEDGASGFPALAGVDVTAVAMAVATALKALTDPVVSPHTCAALPRQTDAVRHSPMVPVSACGPAAVLPVQAFHASTDPPGNAASGPPECACMPCLELRFSAQRLPASKLAELDRQLAGQQAGLNALTVDEYLQARQQYHARLRSRSVARNARVAWRSRLIEQRTAALRAQGMDEAAAQAAATIDVARCMQGQHALHNPDLIAGGRDVIADFGDGDVNATIGRQWNRRRGDTPAQVEQLDAAACQVPETTRCQVHMNGRLQRADP